MKKFIKIFLLANSIIYWSVYLIKSFIIWKFVNPFHWIINIPNYTEEYRGLIFIGVSAYIMVLCVIIWTLSDNNKK